MKYSIFSGTLGVMLFFVGQIPVFAAVHPGGAIIIYNASNNNVTAQVSNFGEFTLASNETKDIAYSTLAKACSSNPTNCTAQFYVNNAPAGFATLNIETGKVINMNLSMKVHTAKGPDNVLRSVVIK